jgi:hypothetical protein
MKKLLLIVVILTTAFTQYSYSQDNSKVSPLAPSLTLYYQVKDALIAGDAGTAAAGAASFVQTVTTVDMQALTPAEHNAFMPLQEKLAADARQIAGTKDISRQRAAFQTLSANFYALAKTARLSAEPVYQAYCPMKKAYWLSSSAAIRNPYFGNQMLTCGKVSDTIK